MNMISLQDRNIQAMRHVAEVLTEHDITPIFYITPIDAKTAVNYLGGEFIERLLENTKLIKSVLAQSHVPVLDLSTVLSTEYFTWTEEGSTALYPNEHLKQMGRMFVVRNLLEHTELKDYFLQSAKKP